MQSQAPDFKGKLLFVTTTRHALEVCVNMPGRSVILSVASSAGHVLATREAWINLENSDSYFPVSDYFLVGDDEWTEYANYYLYLKVQKVATKRTSDFVAVRPNPFSHCFCTDSISCRELLERHGAIGFYIFRHNVYLLLYAS